MKDLIKVAEHKLTAAQIEQDCPTAIAELGKSIAAHLEKARKYKEKADQHNTAAGQYLAEAREACDEGGFSAFRERFFPKLGKSRVYELLQIATDKKSPDEIRAGTRERVAKHRANKAASVTVTENSEPTPDPQEYPASADRGDAPSTQPEPVSEAPKVRGAVSPGNEAVSNFTIVVMRLVQLTKKQKPKNFAKTEVPADALAQLGRLLIGVAELKQSSSSPRPPAFGNGTISPEQSAEGIKARFAAAEATDNLAAA